MRYRSALRGACSVAAILVATNAIAQTGQDAAIEEVIVTGSRAVTNGAQAPTPITVMSAEDLKGLNPQSLGEALNSLPQLRGSAQSTSIATSANQPGAGSNLISLRGLGPARTLVLLDGRRVVPTSQLGVPDINTFPSSLVKRVDIVTGGASAAYGSDAVSGVVNFVLDTTLQGVKGQIQGGIAERGDYGNYKIELAAGHQFLDGKIRLVGAFDYYYLDNPGREFYNNSRPWTQLSGNGNWVDPAGATPRRFRTDQATPSSAAYGGLILSGPLKGIQFRPDGSFFQHDYGTPGRVGTNEQDGGTGPVMRAGIGAAVKPSTNVFVHSEFDIMPEVTFFAEGSHSYEYLSTFQYDLYHIGTNGPLTIFRDNAYLPTAVGALMDANKVTTFVMGRLESEGGDLHINTTVKVNRIALGFKGDIEGFNYNVYYTHGETRWNVDNENNIDDQKYFAAVDTIRHPTTGQPVCRATYLLGNFPGCAPMNPFGEGAPSDAATDYYRGNHYRYMTYRQDVVSFDVRHDLFSLWSDPAVAAVGGEWRKEKSRQVTDSVSQSVLQAQGIRGFPATYVNKQGAWRVGNGLPYAGGYSVKEAFGEVNVPIIKGMTAIEELDVNAAVRMTDYSTSGTVTTWKFGASYKPIDDIRFRFTRSRDIRAPNVGELFASGVGNNGSQFINPLTNKSVTMQGLLNVGNPNLNPEKADTTSVGVVFQPSWAPGLDIAVDYYNINISDAITVPTQQQTLNQCLLEKNPTACSLILSVSDAVINWIQYNINFASLVNRGIDFEVGYKVPVYKGDVTFRGLVAYLIHNTSTTPGAVPFDNAGQYDRPKLAGSFDLGYKQGGLGINYNVKWLNGGIYNKLYRTGVDIDDNSVASIVYQNVSLTYDFEQYLGGDWQAYFTVLNLMDQKPPWAPYQSSTIQFKSSPGDYDQIGRRYVAGVRFKF
jgi:iron complex outermembrane receptor protein